MTDLYFPWRIRFVASWLCLKQRGPKGAIVVRIDPRNALGSGIARMYGAEIGGIVVYDPASEFRVGQAVKLENA